MWDTFSIQIFCIHFIHEMYTKACRNVGYILCIKILYTCCVCPTYSRQKFSGLSWMVKRYYIQDYPENFRGDTETTRTTAWDFTRLSIESSLTRWEKKKTHWWGKMAFYKLLIWTRLESSNVGIRKIIWKLLIFFHASFMMKFSCYFCSQLWARYARHATHTTGPSTKRS